MGGRVTEFRRRDFQSISATRWMSTINVPLRSETRGLGRETHSKWPSMSTVFDQIVVNSELMVPKYDEFNRSDAKLIADRLDRISPVRRAPNSFDSGLGVYFGVNGTGMLTFEELVPC